MKFVKVDMIEKPISHPRASSREVVQLFDDFIASGFEYAKLLYDESDAIKTATLKASVKRYGYPITVAKRGKNIYLIRNIPLEEES